MVGVNGRIVVECAPVFEKKNISRCRVMFKFVVGDLPHKLLGRVFGIGDLSDTQLGKVVVVCSYKIDREFCLLLS